MTYQLDDVKILIVEDMLPMLTLTKSILQIFGFKKVIGARNGEEAFEIYKQDNIDIIITDWMMEPMDGLELIKKIREDSNGPNQFIPIILMTGYSSRARVEKARDNGMTEFLVKPYTAKKLYNKLVHLIEKPRQFVQSKNFCGPDRRRKEDDYDGPIRRKKDYYAAQRKELKEAAEEILKSQQKDPKKT